MMKTIVSPLGFDTSHMVSCIVKEGVDKGDQIIILRPEEKGSEKRGDRAFDDLTNIIEQVSKEIEIQKIVLDNENFDTTVLTISNLLKDAEGKIVLNISGGPRMITIALTTAAIYQNHKVSTLYNYSDVDDEIREIELPYVLQCLNKNEKQILETLVENEEMSYKELGEELSLSKGTISRLTRDMEENDMLQIRGQGREKLARPSLTGELLLKSGL